MVFTDKKTRKKMAKNYGEIYRVDDTLELPVCPKRFFKMVNGSAYIDENGEAELFFLSLKRYQPFVSSLYDSASASVFLFLDVEIGTHRCVVRCIEYGNLKAIIDSQDDADVLKLINAASKIISELSAESIVNVALRRCDAFCEPDYEEF